MEDDEIFATMEEDEEVSAKEENGVEAGVGTTIWGGGA